MNDNHIGGDTPVHTYMRKPKLVFSDRFQNPLITIIVRKNEIYIKL